MGGIPFHSCPSRRRPPDFDVLPPTCLKKNGTAPRSHCSRIPRAQAGSIGRASEPLSPPAITQ